MRAPRPYQDRDSKLILGNLQRRLNPLYVLPTAGGKTDVFCRTTAYVLQHAGWHIGVFVHRVELLDQASDDLTLFGIPHGVVMPGHGITSHKVHVASIDTVLARLAAGCHETARWLASLNLAVLDEAHHAVANKWLRLAQAMAKALLFGVTATPYRTDGQGLGDVFNAAVRGPSIRELTDDGWLTPFAVYAPPTPLNLTGAKKLGGDYRKSDIQAIMDTDELIRLGARWYSRLCPGTPAIWFGTGIAHAEHAAEIYSGQGWNARSVDGTCSKDDRRSAIGGLENGRVQTLMSVDLISEGVNVPVVGAGILDRPTFSTGLFQQQNGRTARVIWPDGFNPITASAAERKAAMAAAGKPFAFIIDMVGNVATHGMPDEDRPWSLKDGVKGQERNVQSTRRCPRCYRVHAWAEVCIGCGLRYPNAPRPAAGQELWRLPGAMGMTAEQIKAMPHKDLMGRVSSVEDLRAIARIKGYQPGWAKNVAANDPRFSRAAGGAR